MAAGEPAPRSLPTPQCLRSCHLFDHVSDAVMVAELPSSRIVLWNAAASRICGYSQREAVGLRLLDVIHPAHRERLRAALAAVTAQAPMELTVLRNDGGVVTVEVAFGLLTGGEETGTLVLAIMRDISDRKRAEAALADRALHDQLTGLPNRWLLEDRFRQTLLAARRGGSAFALLMLDLDGFKEINDRLGHLAGDRLLRQVARRLREAVRDSDTVARTGGDEFVVLLTPAQNRADAEVIAGRVLGGVAAPTHIAGHAITVRASVGVAMFPQNGRDIDALTKAADQAMYAAKCAGGGRFESAELTDTAPAVGTEPVHAPLPHRLRAV